MTPSFPDKGRSRMAPAGARTCRWGCQFPELPGRLDGDGRGFQDHFIA